MSSSINEQIIPVLRASVHDVRHFTSLLRGVNFADRAAVTVTQYGLVVAVEEARTLLGTAYIFSDVFDEYEYHLKPLETRSSQVPQSHQDEEEIENTTFEIQLNTLIECLNIFGTAGGTGSSSGGKHVQLKQDDEEEINSDGEADNNERNEPGRKGGGRKKMGQGDRFFNRSERKTSMRMTYMGEGSPLTLLIAEDSSGPTTTCEIATFEAEPQLELPFDTKDMQLKVILKSSWLKEALSEIDPSCDKLTFIANPPEQANMDGITVNQRPRAKPILRIKAMSTHGTTEMEYLNDRDVLETFDCLGLVSFSYRFVHITRTIRALQTSVKTSLRIDKGGLLSLQFLMPAQRARGDGAHRGGRENFIEFCCLPLDEDIS